MAAAARLISKTFVRVSFRVYALNVNLSEVGNKEVQILYYSTFIDFSDIWT